MKILVCDDDKYYVDLVVDYLKEYESEFIEHSIKTISDSHELLVDIKLNKYDVAFLDIKIGDVNGLDVARSLLESNPNCIIVFVTNYYKFIRKAFKLKVSNFLHKPFTKKAFEETYYQILEEYQLRHSKFIFNTSKGKQEFNPFDIIYVETYYNNLKIVTTSGPHYSNIKNVKYIKAALKPFDFEQVHQSYFVNFNHILKIKGDFVILNNKEELPISANRKQEIIEAFNKFIVRR